MGFWTRVRLPPIPFYEKVVKIVKIRIEECFPVLSVLWVSAHQKGAVFSTILIFLITFRQNYGYESHIFLFFLSSDK